MSEQSLLSKTLLYECKIIGLSAHDKTLTYYLLSVIYGCKFRSGAFLQSAGLALGVSAASLISTKPGFLSKEIEI